jgi:hypothetical protein
VNARGRRQRAHARRRSLDLSRRRFPVTSLAKRLAFLIHRLARPQGGVARVATQSAVLALATSMALCTGRPSLRDPRPEEARLPDAQALEDYGEKTPS